MKRLFALLIVGLVLPIIVSGCSNREEEKSLTIFAGAASKPALDEAGAVFTKQTGIRVYFNYSGSGTMLSQMKLSQSGDLYIPGSPDYIVKAERDNLIDSKSVKIISYLIPVIAVQKGNPKNIQSLSDLAKPGIRVAIANPEAVCLGLYAVEILEYNRLLADVAKNIVTYAESCEKTATLISLKSVDAVIGWHVFHDWDPENIDVVYLKPEQLPRLGYIPVAISSFVKDRESAQMFVDFLLSKPGQDIFKKWGYIATENEARKFAPEAEIGGEYKLPESYRSLVK